MNKQTEALKLALEALETLTQYNMVRANIFRRFEPTCTGDYVDLREFREKAEPTITTLREALAEQPAQQALDKKAENARELGLDYEPAQCAPAAWYDSKTGWTDFHSFKPTRKPSAPDAEWLPLYTTSPQPGEKNQEPVLWMMPDGKTVNKWGLQFYNNVVGTPLYTSPPAQRTWVGLTTKEIREWWASENGLEDCGMAKVDDFEQVVRAIEAKLKEKNTHEDRS